MAITWRPLDLGRSADAHTPPLLISAAFEADSYSIHLTDLTNIWAESLDHAAILERAEEESTSIDPSDGSQLRILLEKLALALSSGPKTTLNVGIDPNSNRERPNIILNLTVVLPGGLPPLEWRIHLAAVPQSVLTDQLTVPLLLAQYARNREMEELEEVLKDKDHVIQKLLDKLEAQATDLGQVFPQATAKGGRKVDRARVLEKVRGVASFDMASWRKSLGGDGERPIDAAQLIQQVFEGAETFDQAIGSGMKGDNWWQRIKSSTTAKSKDKASPSGAKVPSKSSLKPRESTEDNDAFQVQSTPHSASQAPKASPSIALDESTDEEDLDAPSQATKITDSYPSQQPVQKTVPKAAEKRNKIGERKERPKQLSPGKEDSTSDEEIPAPRSAKRLGNIGGKKLSPPLAKDDSTDDDEPLPPNFSKKLGKTRGRKDIMRPKPSALLSGDEETTDDEQSSPSRDRSPSQSPTPPPISAAKPKKGRLGQIGGKKEPPPPSPSPQPSLSLIESPNPKKSKLGIIGKRKKEVTPEVTRIPPDPAPQRDVMPAKRKLGVIGGRNKSNAQKKNSDIGVEEEDGRGRERPVKAEREITPPRETSEERATKKRLQLKQELEAKAKAPAKKKRKL